MKDALATAFEQLDALRRPASIATVGGFRPPVDPLTWWIMRGVGLPHERLPQWNGEDMLPLLQVRIHELPMVPPALSAVAMLVVFVNRSTIPFDRPHGDGWLIRDYATLDGLVPIAADTGRFRPFPLSWHRVEDDMPGWDDAWALMDLGPINADEAATGRFFHDFNRYDGIKVGGYPRDIQHAAGLDGFVFQIDSDAKSGWTWAGDGIAYVHRVDGEEWRFSCQMT